MAFQQIIIVGNLGSDPELRYLPSGTAVVNVNIAVNESWSDRQTNERREKTTWFRVSSFGKQAETVSKYLSKGRQVMVIGTVEANAFMGQDGQPRASLELRAREIKFLSGSAADRSSGGSSSSSSSSDGGSSYDDHAPPPQDMDDIPF